VDIEMNEFFGEYFAKQVLRLLLHLAITP